MPASARRTERDDWLANALAANPNIFVSASPSSSKGILDVGLVSVRVIAHHPHGEQPGADRATWLPSRYEIMTLILAVELPSLQYVNDFRFTDHPRLMKMHKRLEKTFSVDVACIGFEQRDDPGTGSEWFVVTQAALNLNNALVNPRAYAAMLNEKRAPPELRDPSAKPVTKSVNDVLAWWSRNFLSHQLAVNDIDAIDGLNGDTAPVLLELKRSGVKNWLPFLNDVPNFVLLNSVATLGKCQVAVVNYDFVPSYVVGLFTIPNVSRIEISGRQKKVSEKSPETFTSAFQASVRSITGAGQLMDGESYTSTRRMSSR